MKLWGAPFLCLAATLGPAPASAQDSDFACLFDNLPPGVAEAMAYSAFTELGLANAPAIDFKEDVFPVVSDCLPLRLMSDSEVEAFATGSIASAIHRVIKARLVSTQFPMEVVTRLSQAYQAIPGLDLDQYAAENIPDMDRKLADAAVAGRVSEEFVRAMLGSVVALEQQIAVTTAQLAAEQAE